MVDYLPFILFLMVLAVFLQAESALTVIYLIIGTFSLGIWWNKRALQHVEIDRNFDDHAFLGQIVPVCLTVHNRSILPILWLETHESLPVNLRAGRSVKHVFSIGFKGKNEIHYEVNAFKRGYYKIGPLIASSGDPLGLIEPTQVEFQENSLTVYPQILSLEALGLPSRSPFGTIKHHNPVFEDPSRIMGKRNFQPGDSIRRIDWKSTAATGNLLVKLYEASIALEVAILLDLDRESYEIKSFYDATELSITAAASLAAWGKQKKQAIGLITNGLDPLHPNNLPNPVIPKKGAGHFINILELLARIQPNESTPVSQLIQKARADLSWGTTMILISGKIRPNTLHQIFQTRKVGFNPVIILTGRQGDITNKRQAAGHLHIPLYTITYPRDLEKLGMTTP